MNYYELLGIPPKSSRDQIRAAYLRLAREVHPDRHVGSGEHAAEREKFKRIQEAYEVLYDAEKRADYDLRHGSIPQRRADQAQRGPAAPMHQGPVRSSPGARRDVPDGWVRGGGNPKRVLHLCRLVALAVIMVAVVSTIPRCSRYLEAQLTTALPDLDSHANGEDADSLPADAEIATIEKQLAEVQTGSQVTEPIYEANDESQNTTTQESLPKSIADYSLQQAEKMTAATTPYPAVDSTESTFTFSDVVTSQDGTNSSPQLWKPSPPSPPTLSTVDPPGDSEPMDWTPPSSRTNHLLNGQTPSYATSPTKIPSQKNSKAPRSHTLSGGDLLPSNSNPSLATPGRNQFDNLRPNFMGGSGPKIDRFKDRMGSAFSDPPASDSFSRPSFQGLESSGFRNLRSNGGLPRGVPGSILSPGANTDRYSPSSRGRSGRPSY